MMCLIQRGQCSRLGTRFGITIASLSHGLVRHADWGPSVYGSSTLWLSGFIHQKLQNIKLLLVEGCLATAYSYRKLKVPNLHVSPVHGIDSVILISCREYSIGRRRSSAIFECAGCHFSVVPQDKLAAIWLFGFSHTRNLRVN